MYALSAESGSVLRLEPGACGGGKTALRAHRSPPIAFDLFPSGSFGNWRQQEHIRHTQASDLPAALASSPYAPALHLHGDGRVLIKFLFFLGVGHVGGGSGWGWVGAAHDGLTCD